MSRSLGWSGDCLNVEERVPPVTPVATAAAAPPGRGFPAQGEVGGAWQGEEKEKKSRVVTHAEVTLAGWQGPRPRVPQLT